MWAPIQAVIVLIQKLSRAKYSKETATGDFKLLGDTKYCRHASMGK